jgi:hypothetical protein
MEEEFLRENHPLQRHHPPFDRRKELFTCSNEKKKEERRLKGVREAKEL